MLRELRSGPPPLAGQAPKESFVTCGTSPDSHTIKMNREFSIDAVIRENPDSQPVHGRRELNV